MTNSSVNFSGPAADTITTYRAIVNIDANTQYMIPDTMIDGIMADASYFVKKDWFTKEYTVTENIYNKDTIQVHEITQEWYETVLPITGRTTVAREIGRKVIVEKVFKFSKKNGGSWK